MNCVYGLEADAFAEDSQLHAMLMRCFAPSLRDNVINALLSTFPFIETFYKESFFPTELTEWFYDIMEHAIKIRSADSSRQRQDLLNFLLTLNHSPGDLSTEKLAAWAATFFFDGYETTSTILVQVLYHLAENVGCQEKLREEIENMEEISMAYVNDLEYLNNVVNGKYDSLPRDCVYVCFDPFCRDTPDCSIPIFNGQNVY